MFCAGSPWSAAAPRGEDPAGEFPRPEAPCRCGRTQGENRICLPTGRHYTPQINVLEIRSDAALTPCQGKIDALRDARRETTAGRGRFENAGSFAKIPIM